MWTQSSSQRAMTNTVVCPTTGPVGIVVPPKVSVTAFVNDVETPIHHVHVTEGDKLYFKLDSSESVPHTVKITYGGVQHDLTVMPIITDSVAPATKIAASKSPSSAPAKMSKAERKKIKKLSKQLKETEMTGKEDINVFGAVPGMGGGVGTGAGVSAFGGALVGGLLNRNGLFGNGENGVSPAFVTNAVNDAAIMTQLADIKASVPLAESQVQLALAGQAATLTQQINSAENMLTSQGQAQALASLAGFNGVNTAIFNSTNETIGVANTNNIAQINAINASAVENLKSAFALQTSITAEGVLNRAATESSKDQILAALNARAQLEDTRLITNLSNEVTELRGDRRLAEATGNITITNTNTANAIAQQQQTQAQFQILANLNAQVANLANDIQVVRQGQTIFNSGTMAGSGTQTAANTKVN